MDPPHIYKQVEIFSSGKVVTVPGFTTGSVATESMRNSEVVRRMLENLMKIMSEFQESDMRKKLSECQGVQLQAYQHQDNYIEGDKVWFQPMNGNAWLGLAVVVCQRGHSVYRGVLIPSRKPEVPPLCEEYHLGPKYLVYILFSLNS